MPKKIQRFRFKVNGKDYNNIDPKKQTKIRWFISDKGKMKKLKENSGLKKQMLGG